MTFIFRDTYALELSPRRKGYEELSDSNTAVTIAKTNELYRKYLSEKNRLDTKRNLCEDRATRANPEIEGLRRAKSITNEEIQNFNSEIDDLKDFDDETDCFEEIDTLSTNISDDIKNQIDTLSTSSCVAAGSPFSDYPSDLTSLKSTIESQITGIDTTLDNLLDDITNNSAVDNFDTGIDNIISNIIGGDPLSSIETDLDNLLSSMTQSEVQAVKVDLQATRDDIGTGITTTSQVETEIDGLRNTFNSQLNDVALAVTPALTSISPTSDTSAIDNVNTELGTASATAAGLSYMGDFRNKILTATSDVAGYTNNIVNNVESFKTNVQEDYDNLQETRLKEIISKNVSKEGIFKTYNKLVNGQAPFELIDQSIRDQYTGTNAQAFADFVGFTGDNSLLKNPPLDESGNIISGGAEQRLNNIDQNITELENELAQCQAEVTRLENNIKNSEFDLIKSLIEDAATQFSSSKLNPVEVLAKFQFAKQRNPNINPLAFVESEFRRNPGGPLTEAEKSIRKISQKANRFRDIVEQRPDADVALKELRQYTSILDPGVCGMTALNNDGTLLNDSRFNIPFQYISDFKESKSANYNETTPIGRFEPHKAYGGGSTFDISFELGYAAFDSGPNKDESFVQEIKDKWLASLYPIYGKNVISGTQTYGTPNKFLLNVYDRYINIPVIVKEVSFEEVGPLDVNTFFSMYLKFNITLSTSYKLSQVVSADDIVTTGSRAYSNKLPL